MYKLCSEKATSEPAVSPGTRMVARLPIVSENEPEEDSALSGIRRWEEQERPWPEPGHITHIWNLGVLLGVNPQGEHYGGNGWGRDFERARSPHCASAWPKRVFGVCGGIHIRFELTKSFLRFCVFL